MAYPTFRETRHRLARRLNDHWTGTLADMEPVTTTAFRLPNRPERADYFVNAWFRVGIDSDAEEHLISASGPADPNVTIGGAGLANQHEAGTFYEIHRRFSAEHYNESLLDALSDARSEAVLANLDYQVLTWVQDQWEYDIPTNFKYINRVQIEDAEGKLEQDFDLEELRIVPGIPRKLEFSRRYSTTPGHTIRILGQGPEADPPDLDSSSVQIDQAFLLAHAELTLRTILAEGEDQIAAANRGRLRDLATLVELKRQALTTEHRVLPGSIVIP